MCCGASIPCTTRPKTNIPSRRMRGKHERNLSADGLGLLKKAIRDERGESTLNCSREKGNVHTYS